MQRIFRGAALWLTLVFSAVLAPAQSHSSRDLAIGKLLVAPRDPADPHFAETVVLLIKAGDDGALGLILNRRTTVPVSRVLHDLRGASQSSEPMFVGGPVETTSIMALYRGTSSDADSSPVVHGVYLAWSKDRLEALLAHPKPGASVRVFAGYCGWEPGQLENELDLGAWFILDGNESVVFDRDPDTLWKRLIEQADVTLALARFR